MSLRFWLSIFTAILFSTQALAQDVYTNKEIQDLLELKGVPVKAWDITTVYTSPELVLVKGDQFKCFAVIATKSYASYLPDPVIAYGTGASLSYQNENFLSMIDGYQEYLRMLKDGDMVHSTASADKVLPMMDGIQWGQRDPYNRLFPKMFDGRDSVRALAGCGPVALAQILKYQGHPASDDPSALLIDLANALGAEFGVKSTRTNTGPIKEALTDRFGISPRCTTIKVKSNSELELIRSELQEGRPLVLNGHDHFFVCDGYDRHYLHLNFGWNGSSDGYYTLPENFFNEKGEAFFNYMTIGIEPDLYTDFSRTVDATHAGSLGTMLSQQEKLHLHSLKITGEINGCDIRVLRLMAGATDENEDIRSRGSLQYLDLSEATIVADKLTPYFTVDAKEFKFYIWKEYNEPGKPVRRVEYHFESITDQEWAEVTENGMHRGASYLIRKEDNRYLVDYFTQRNTIGKFMFADCSNLKEVVISKDNMKTAANAFRNTTADIIRK